MPKKLVLAAVAATAAIGAVAAYGAGGMSMGMGPEHSISVRGFRGYYDGHFVTYLNTDVSTKAQATAMHINYSKRLASIKGEPEIYLVEGRSASGQLAVFGSEPGEPSYSPLWDETILTWKAGATPVVIKSDTQVNALEKKGVLSERDGHAVLNCPIIKVGS
jgi:hypothetical protein